MTTPNDQPPAEQPTLDFTHALDAMLELYQPANFAGEADKHFTTPEIIQAIETHYGIPQGDPELSLVNGYWLVEELSRRGYKYVNTGGLQLSWILKKKG